MEAYKSDQSLKTLDLRNEGHGQTTRSTVISNIIKSQRPE